jgi:hypothetical protein
MNLQENVNRIKEVMGILKEETELELRKIMTDKFSGVPYYGTFERQGEYVAHKYFSKSRNGNILTKFKPTEDFYTSEVLDGPEKGRVVKVYTDDAKKNRELVTKNELQTKFDEKIKNFPCMNPDDVAYLRQTSDGKVLAGYLFIVGSDDSTEYVVYFNLDDKTYSIKGGEHDGEQGEFSCNGGNRATALIERHLARAQRDGFEGVMLGVDTESLTGANKLYERVGFTPRYGGVRYILGDANFS